MSLTNKKVIKVKNNDLKTKWILNDDFAKILFLAVLRCYPKLNH